MLAEDVDSGPPSWRTAGGRGCGPVAVRVVVRARRPLRLGPGGPGRQPLVGAWWAPHCRLRRMVLGAAVDTLAARVERLRHDAIAFGPDGDDLQRYAELCATVQRLLRD